MLVVIEASQLGRSISVKVVQARRSIVSSVNLRKKIIGKNRKKMAITRFFFKDD